MHLLKGLRDDSVASNAKAGPKQVRCALAGILFLFPLRLVISRARNAESGQ